MNRNKNKAKEEFFQFFLHGEYNLIRLKGGSGEVVSFTFSQRGDLVQDTQQRLGDASMMRGVGKWSLYVGRVLTSGCRNEFIRGGCYCRSSCCVASLHGAEPRERRGRRGEASL